MENRPIQPRSGGMKLAGAVRAPVGVGKNGSRRAATQGFVTATGPVGVLVESESRRDGTPNRRYNLPVKTKLRKIGNGLGVLLPKEAIARLGVCEGSTLTISDTASGIELSPFDADFSAQVEAFRRTEARHRNSYRALAK